MSRRFGDDDDDDSDSDSDDDEANSGDIELHKTKKKVVIRRGDPKHRPPPPPPDHDNAPRRNPLRTEPEPALPPGWEQDVDEATGMPYYYNMTTNIRTWARPMSA